jgi:prepilin-type N-terminal cleavage/methylation domain-containing protein
MKSAAMRITKKQTGFTLIELLIVIAIILIIAAIAIPNLMHSKISANEASAVASVRTISTAELQYVGTYPNLGYADTLEKLGPTKGAQASANAAGLIDPALARGSKSGYKFTLSAVKGDNGMVTGFTIAAEPTAPGTTGVKSYCSDQSNVIYYQADGGPCTPGTSAVLE